MKFDTISMFPDGGSSLGKIMDDISPIFSNFQKRLAKNYIIIYKHYEADNIAVVFHIFHKSQNYGRLFQK